MISALNRIFETIRAVIEGIFDFLIALIPSGNKTEYDASFASPSEVLSRYNKGFSFGNKSLSIASSLKNGILYGPSGSGKSASVLCNSILRMIGTSSLIINDPSGQLYKWCSKALILAGYVVKVINWAKPELGGYNPLTRVKSTADIQKLSKMLIQNALGQSKEMFWNLSSEALLSCIIKLVVKYQPKEVQNLHSVLYLLNLLSYAPGKLDILYVRSNDDALIAEYKTFVSYDSKTLSNIIATCKAALNIFSSEDVALCTAYDSIDIESCRSQKTAIFINNSIPDMKFYAVLTSIFVDQTLAIIMSSIPDAKSIPLFILLDEASSLSLNASLPIAIANCRKYLCGLLLCYQSPFQLVNIFSQSGAKAIEENAFARVYMPPIDIEIAAKLEQTIGKFEYKDKAGVRHIRPLMTSSEIRESADESFLIFGSHRVVKMHLKGFYEIAKFRTLTKLRPYEPNSCLPFTTPPLVKIDEAKG